MTHQVPLHTHIPEPVGDCGAVFPEVAGLVAKDELCIGVVIGRDFSGLFTAQ